MSATRWCTILLLGALASGCATSSERWAEVRFQDVSYLNLYRAVADVLGSEGYPVKREDPVEGLIETEWRYGESVREVRGPSRTRAFVTIEPSEIEREDQDPLPVTLVRVRVPEEVIRKGGLLARNERNSEDWEEYKDDFERAEFLAEKIRILLADHHVSARTLAGAVDPGDDGESVP
ncbi:MAG: hypothetical protein H6825_15585 [Planctomycetes bacterium]|nr:hypothetical protein [Planctomycetota bacterium]